MKDSGKQQPAVVGEKNRRFGTLGTTLGSLVKIHTFRTIHWTFQYEDEHPALLALLLLEKPGKHCPGA